MVGYENDDGLLSVQHYDDMLQKYSGKDPASQELIENWKADRERAFLREKATAEWMSHYEEYVDQFKTEICLALRKGVLTAVGRQLPDLDYERAVDVLEAEGKYLPDLNDIAIPPENWTWQGIKWEASALCNRSHHFIWIHVDVEAMLKVFPPDDIIKLGEVVRAGEMFAVPSAALNGSAATAIRRGRRPLPWDRFHIEVARLFRDHAMPEKKEAAIAYFQDWFKTRLGQEASRSVIGAKLKPYFDELLEKDRK
jgi:hypothetical protein